MENLTKLTCLGLLFASVVKALVSGFNPSIAICVVSFCSILYGIEKIKETKETSKVIADNTKKIQEIQDSYKEQSKELMDMRSYFASVKISNQLRVK